MSAPRDGHAGGNELDGRLRLGTDYFCYCEVGFTERVIGDHIVTMVSVWFLRTSLTASSLRLLDRPLLT